MSVADSQATFRANEVDLSNICAEILARIAKNRHIIFLLQGDIGAGKTTLVKAFAKQIGISDSVTSPTFSLLHIYCAEFRLNGTTNSSIVSEKSGLCSCEQGNKTNGLLTKRTTNLPDLSPQDEFALDSANSQNLALYHYDLFNRTLGELLDLGLLDLLGESGIHFVEWGDSQLFEILKNAFENICIISIHKTKNDRIYEFKESF